MDIRFVPYSEIDKLRYDSCVHYSANGNIFGYHWYLKNVLREFDVLVEGNYESVMPLISKRNLLGQPILFHPPMIGRLGIFSTHVLSKPRVLAFLNAIPSTYHSCHIIMNEGVRLPKDAPIPYKKSLWQYLDLNLDYEILKTDFSQSLDPIIEETQSWNLKPRLNMKPEEVLKFYKSVDKRIDEHAWMRIFYNLMHRGTAFSMVMENKKGEIVSAALFAYHYGYLTQLFYAHQKGYAKIIYKHIIDVLKTHAGRSLTLDFNRLPPKIGDAFGATSLPIYELQKLSRWQRLFPI